MAYILELLDDEEEVLMALTETLGGMLDYCGGPAHSEHLFRILEKLFAIEEHSVREKVSLRSFIFIGNRKHEENSSPNNCVYLLLESVTARTNGNFQHCELR